MKQKTIGTDRLLLIPFSRADLADLHKLNSDSDVMKYIRDPEKNLDTTLKSLERMLLLASQNPGLGFWKITTKEEHDFVGWVGLFPLENSQEIELGYRLHKKFWGQEIAKEACLAVLNILPTEKQIFKCVAVTHLENSGSKRVLEKIGFQHMGKAHHYGVELDKFAFEFPQS